VPIHDWTRVDAGLFHSFHQRWISSLCDSLNLGRLPADYFALAEQSIREAVPDVLTLRLSSGDEDSSAGPGQTGLAVAEAPPRACVVQRSEADIYAWKANRIVVRHRHGEIVAVVEIVSPGNKGSKSELQAFVDKSVRLIRQGIHLLVIDIFPPTKRDPQGIHKLIWDEFEEDEEYQLPADKPLVLAAYDAGPSRVAYVEFVGVGDPLPEMSIFLRPGYYIRAPLDETYQTSWSVFPKVLKGLLEPGR
jgi:hypothetical protein